MNPRLSALIGLLVPLLGQVGDGPPGPKKEEARKVASIKEVMKAAHDPRKGFMQAVRAAAKAGDWNAARQAATSYLTLVADLKKNTPPKGDAGSWSKFASRYEESVKGARDAANEKDAKNVEASLRQVMASCGACHREHKK